MKHHHLFKDETGKTYGRLKVIKLSPKSEWKEGIATWVCECSCGHNVVVRGTFLRYGSTKSCGCLRKKAGKKHANSINYKASGKYSMHERVEDIFAEFDELNIL